MVVLAMMVWDFRSLYQKVLCARLSIFAGGMSRQGIIFLFLRDCLSGSDFFDCNISLCYEDTYVVCPNSFFWYYNGTKIDCVLIIPFTVVVLDRNVTYTSGSVKMFSRKVLLLKVKRNLHLKKALSLSKYP